MTNSDFTARSGKTQTLGEVLEQMGYTKPESQTATQDQNLVAVLTRIQRMHVPERYFLMWEHWDWLVVLQCMQDHGLFKSNPKRPPLAAFEQWLHEHDVPQLLAKCPVYEMSLASRALRGARYPWANATWEPYVLARWRVLYRTLDSMLHEMGS